MHCTHKTRDNKHCLYPAYNFTIWQSTKEIIHAVKLYTVNCCANHARSLQEAQTKQDRLNKNYKGANNE